MTCYDDKECKVASAARIRLFSTARGRLQQFQHQQPQQHQHEQQLRTTTAAGNTMVCNYNNYSDSAFRTVVLDNVNAHHDRTYLKARVAALLCAANRSNNGPAGDYNYDYDTSGRYRLTKVHSSTSMYSQYFHTCGKIDKPFINLLV
jgi:phage gp16-like protein